MEAAELVITPEEQSPLQREAIQRGEDEVRAYLQVLQGGQGRQPKPPKLVFEDGTQLELSPDILEVLQFVLHHVAQQDAIGLIPMTKPLSTNQAAEILNVSRPFLVNLLNEGAIKFFKVGTHRRLRMGDVLEYKRRRDREMLDTLNDLANEAQEAGEYFND